MKIAFVYDAVYPWIKGGGEKRIYELGKRLAENDHEVHVFGIKWWEGADVIKYDGMVLHGVCGAMELYVNSRRSISEAIIFSIKLIPHLFKGRFDVIDVSAFPYLSCFSVKMVSIFTRSPMIITWHEVWGNYWYEYMGIAGFFGKLVEKIASKLVYRSIAVSAMTGMNLESLGVDGHAIRIVPNGIDLKRIASITLSEHECEIIFVGRLIKEKNVDVLIEAVDIVRRELPDVKCHIIGDGPEKERLTGIVALRGLSENVRFFEFMDHDEMIARMKSSKVLVLPSSREGFGMVVIEAFMCGVPVVTVRSPMNAASLLVNEDNGNVVNLDAREIAEAIVKLIKNTTLHEKISTHGMITAQGYDWDFIARQLKDIYENLMITKN